MPDYKPIVTVFVALFFMSLLNSWIGQQQDAYFGAALDTANVTPPDSGLAAKELAYARTLAERNPLLAVAGTNPDNLESSFIELSILEQRVYEINASSTNAKLLYNLYPVNFIGALANLERARQTFIDSGSKTDEAAYQTATERAFAAYDSDTQAFTKAFTLAVPETAGKFATDGDIISRAGILSAVATLQKNMQEKEAVFTARTQCLRGDITKCNAGDLAEPNVTVSPEVAILPAQLAQAKAVRALSVEAHAQPAIADGPLFLLPSTQCAANMNGGAPLFTFYQPASLGEKRPAFPLYLGDIRFNTSSASSSVAFQKFNTAITQKITYILDSPMLHYSCLELAHDSGKLFAMRDVYTFAQQEQLSHYATSTEDRATFTALEQSHLSVVTPSQVEAYLFTARILPLPPVERREVRDLTLSYLNNSAHFDANIGEILADEESNVALVKTGWPIDLEVPYMFFIRSAAPMLLLADNVSGAGGIQKLFPPNTLEKTKQPFVYYSQLPHTPAMIQKLIHDIHFFYAIHDDTSLVSGLVTK